MRLQVTIAFLLGVVATLLAVVVFSPKDDVVHAQAASSGASSFVGVTGNASPGGRDMLWLVDASSDTPHLALYEWSGNKLMMHAARNIKYDMMYDQYPSKSNAHRPSVQEVYKETSKQSGRRR